MLVCQGLLFVYSQILCSVKLHWNGRTVVPRGGLHGLCRDRAVAGTHTVRDRCRYRHCVARVCFSVSYCLHTCYTPAQRMSPAANIVTNCFLDRVLQLFSKFVSARELFCAFVFVYKVWATSLHGGLKSCSPVRCPRVVSRFVIKFVSTDQAKARPN